MKRNLEMHQRKEEQHLGVALDWERLHFLSIENKRVAMVPSSGR